MKRKSFRASRGMEGELNSDEDIIENGTRNCLLSLMIKCKLKASALREGGGGGTWIQTRIKSRELYNESSSFSKDFNER